MKRLQKRDILLIGGLLLAALLAWFFFAVFGKKAGAYVTVTVNGEIYGTYPLAVEQTIDIKKDAVTTNVLVIADGRADMKEADCPDQLCVHQRAISRSKESIICLPNKVVVTVEQAGTPEYDSMAR